MEQQYIYLLQEREFIRLNEKTYKIGKTKQPHNKGMNNYPIGSKLIFQILCDNCDELEKKLIKIFTKKFKQRDDYGKEYFEGEYTKMIKIIYENVCTKFKCQQKRTENVIESLYSKLDDLNMEIELLNGELEMSEEDVEYICEEKKHKIERIEKRICKLENKIEKLKRYEINTYENYLKCCVHDSQEIVITDKKKMKGYWNLNGNYWKELYDKNIEEDKETLHGLVNHFANKYKDYNAWKNIHTNDFVVSLSKLKELEKEELTKYNTNIKLVFNIDKIVKDIIKKCYVKDPNYYDLKYHEYLIQINDEFKIFNAKTQTFHNTNEFGIIRNRIPFGAVFYSIPYDDIDISFVDKIFNIFINDKKVLDDFKKFCYYVFVKEHDDVKLFTDFYSMRKTNADLESISILMEWIAELYGFLRKGKMVSTFTCETINECNEIIKNNRPTLGIISSYSDKNVANKIKKNVTNVICTDICHDMKTLRNLYNFTGLKIFLEEHEKYIETQIHEKNKDMMNMNDVTNIFSQSYMLPIHFLKWCCNQKV